MNKITIYFDLCTPAPAGGYKIYYRVTGTGGSYTFAGTFFNSPAVFYDTINPPGTCYEGYIVSDCGNDIVGNSIPWESCGSVVEGGNIYVCIDAHDENIGHEIFVGVNSTQVVTVNTLCHVIIHTNHADYPFDRTLIAGTTASFHGKLVYSGSNPDETMIGADIISFVPATQGGKLFIFSGFC